VRTLGKAIVEAISTVLVIPLVALYKVHLVLAAGRSDEVIQGYSQLVALGPGLPGVYLRRAFYRFTLRTTPRSWSMGFGTIVATPAIDIGEGTYIGAFCNLSHASIGADVLIGSNVTILAGKHIHRFDRLDIPIRHQGGVVSPLSIGEDVWIGNGAIVMADVGPHAVVAAGAVVVKPVPSLAIVAGNPARVLSMRGAVAAEAVL
jgi:acetyltransferase-like isoleucine patch superfamily enzyme